MIPVYQSIIGTGRTNEDGSPSDDGFDPSRGDCLRAAIASVFELPIEEVPHFVAHENHWNELVRWCAERNVRVEWRHCTEWRDQEYTDSEGNVKTARSRDFPAPYGCWSIATVPSRAFAGHTHAVVVFGDEIKFDPNPENAERDPYDRDEIRGFYHFFVIDPAKQRKEAA